MNQKFVRKPIVGQSNVMRESLIKPTPVNSKKQQKMKAVLSSQQ